MVLLSPVKVLVTITKGLPVPAGPCGPVAPVGPNEPVGPGTVESAPATPCTP